MVASPSPAVANPFLVQAREARRLGERTRAQSLAERAVQTDPRSPEAQCLLGDCLRDQRRLAEARGVYLKALELDQRHHPSLSGLGLCLRLAGLHADAVRVFRLALQLTPDDAVTHFRLAHALESNGEADAAIGAYLEAIKRRPDYAEAFNNLGNCLFRCGHVSDAGLAYDRAIAAKPDFAAAHSNRLAVLNYRHDLDPAVVADAHKAWAEVHADPLTQAAEAYGNEVDPARPLRVGFISRDLYRHSVSFFLLPLLEHMDSHAWEVCCYQDGSIDDAMTARLKAVSRRWRQVDEWSDKDLADRVRADGIDVLVDLAGHTAGNRLGVFARRPAPVQLTWLGYPNTTGMGAFDGRLSDALVEPVGEADAWSREPLVRLAGGMHCYTPPSEAPEVAPLPALQRGHVTFGTFNNLAKFNLPTAALWARILDAVPGSRLIFKTQSLADGAARQFVLDAFARVGVGEDRLELRPWAASVRDSLQMYADLDVALDTFPYNGTTTTCEALWMGVPVVTLCGRSPASRVSAAILERSGLGALVATSDEGFVSVARTLAENLGDLSRLRGSLRAKLAASTVCDAPGFARQFADAVRPLWTAWCRRQPRLSVVPELKSLRPEDAAPESAVASTAAPIEAPSITPARPRGAIYVVWGEREDFHLRRSQRSLQEQHPELAVEVITLPAHSTLLDKARMFAETPFRETLFLDTDTVVLDRLDYGFEMARRHGLACCICECPWARRYPSLEGDAVEYNTGVLFFTPAARPVFERWAELAPVMDSSILFYAGKDLRRMPLNDQASFARAVDEWGRAPFVLPMNWNLRPIWQHSFFGPIKIWHDRSDVPPEVVVWNEDQTRPQAVVQFGHLPRR